MRHLLFKTLIFTILSSVQVLTDQQPFLANETIQISNDLIPLIDLLVKKGFKVKFKSPPQKGVYGSFNNKSKTLWISPISFELGIGRHTLLHEATHAAQSCPHDSLTLVGWDLPISPFISNEIQSILFNKYKSTQYAIEQEAFSLQGQKNAIGLLLKALNERCK